MANLKISIIMPNFNGEKHIKKSIKHFLLQEYTNKELIILDAKSTDASHEIIEEFTEKNSNILWIKEQDIGISDAFNKGIDVSTGDIIGYLGSDDLLYRGILEEVAYHAEWCDFDAIYFDSYTYYFKERKCILRKCPNLNFSKESLLSYGTIVGWQDIFFKRSKTIVCGDTDPGKLKYNLCPVPWKDKVVMNHHVHVRFKKKL